MIRMSGLLVGVTAGLGTISVAAVGSRLQSEMTQAMAAPIPVAPPPAPFVMPESENPRVEPGKVRWHATFAAAQSAAKQSGKPVLLFHMMGHLDRQFC